MNKLRLFGTSGIRGKAETEMTPLFAKKLGITFADLLGNEGTVIVGRDVRLSAKTLANAIISGLVSEGISVEDCGVVPTPALLWALKKRSSSHLYTLLRFAPFAASGFVPCFF